jgi:hypothetical protein
MSTNGRQGGSDSVTPSGVLVRPPTLYTTKDVVKLVCISFLVIPAKIVMVDAKNSYPKMSLSLRLIFSTAILSYLIKTHRPPHKSTTFIVNGIAIDQAIWGCRQNEIVPWSTVYSRMKARMESGTN